MAILLTFEANISNGRGEAHLRTRNVQFRAHDALRGTAQVWERDDFPGRARPQFSQNPLRWLPKKPVHCPRSLRSPVGKAHDAGNGATSSTWLIGPHAGGLWSPPTTVAPGPVTQRMGGCRGRPEARNGEPSSGPVVVEVGDRRQPSVVRGAEDELVVARRAVERTGHRAGTFCSHPWAPAADAGAADSEG
eukprot:gene6546-biopygen7927